MVKVLDFQVHSKVAPMEHGIRLMEKAQTRFSRYNYALVEATDEEIYNALASCYDEEYAKKNECLFNNQLVGEKAKKILGEVTSKSLHTQDTCLTHIGEHVQRVMPDLETQTPAAIYVAEALFYRGRGLYA